jgi:DNA gyrase/topoisomerase IV subunit B
MQKFISDGCVLLLLLPLYKYKSETHVQCQQKENKRKATEHDQGLEEENGPPNEDVNVMEAFRDFHTSRKKGLSNATRTTVVSTFFCFP